MQQHQDLKLNNFKTDKIDVIKTEKKVKHLNTLEKCQDRLHINDTYIDTYNSISQTLHQRAAHTTPVSCIKQNQSHNVLHNRRTAHLTGNRYTKT
jgi:hypothetical protein